MRRVFACFILFTVMCFFAFGSLPPIQKKAAGMQRFSGFFPFYWDDGAGKLWLEIDKLEQEFLYVQSLTAGIGSNDIGLDRNQLGGTHVVKFQRLGPKVLLVQPNYSFRATSGNPDERRAAEEAFAQSVLWGFEVAAEEESRILVDATGFLLQDAHGVIGRLQRADQGVFQLDSSRSALYLPRTKNFPSNSEFEAILTFKTRAPGNFVREVAPHPQAVTVRQHHSFIRLPDDRYKPRAFDPRANFFGFSFLDFSAPIDQPLAKRVIARHRLEKKDPEAAVSEPVKPIVYYVDAGVPEPVRSALIEGAGWWNEAFEAIGYKNAFRVEVLPEGADPMDIRYNVINWIHRSTRGWSYGSTVIDPRTGEILKGHVALGSQRLRQDFLIAQGLVGDFGDDREAVGPMVKMALARIRQLSCHEVGHTLGMGHNYAASANNRASVMDYPHPQVKVLADGRLDLSDAYATGIGDWDKVSIAYGYQHFPDGVDEDKALRDILDSAFSRGLYFLAGQDAGPGSAHPLANVWDNGPDPVEELERVMAVRASALASFSEKRIPVGEPMALLEDVLVPVYLFHRYQVEAAASVLGGVVYNHRLRGDVQKDPELVPASTQRNALETLLQTIAPANLVLEERILNMIPPRPPGYGQTRELFPGYTGDTFDPLAAAETAAGLTAGLILHPQRAARLIVQHARNEEFPGLCEVIDTLLDFTWKSGAKPGLQAEVQRVVNHVVLYNLMRLAVEESAAPQAKAVSLLKIEELKRWLVSRVKVETDEGQRAHFLSSLNQVERFLEDPEEFLLPSPLAAPPGAPIGMPD